MKNLLKVVFFVVQSIATVSYANVDTTCIENDCLTKGWDNLDTRTGDTSTINCYNNDCAVNGWSNVYKERLASEVLCKPGGCFTEGWTVRNPNTNTLIADVSCQASFAYNDCLQFGWVTYEPQYGSYVTRCVNGDCRTLGWDVNLPNNRGIVSTRCKAGGCFETGWITYN